MIKKIQQDFSYYSHEFKDNYRKGVHRLRTILASRAQAQAFVSNAGGTAVVLGYEPDAPDKNAQELYALLAASPYIDDAVQTFLGSIYETGAENQNAMYSDSARCLEILHDPVMARAAGAGAVSAGKWIATLAGQSCNLYRDMNAVAASDIAMTAVAASETAMAAVVSNATALNAVVTSQAAMNAVAASETAMAAIAASQTAMTAVAASQTAMAAVAASQTAMAAVIGNSAALNAVVSSQTAMTAVAASQTAMTAVAASQTARAAIEKSQVAKDAIAASDMATAKYAVGAAGLKPADYANMAAVAASQTAMAAVINSEAARTALVSSSVARKALKASSLAVEMSLVSSDGQYWNSIGTKTMRGLILYTKAGNTDNAFTITKVDSTTLASNNNARNAATSGSTGYKDWLEAFPNSSWVLSSITFYAYYRTTKIKYIPC